MAERNDYSEVIAEILIELQRQSEVQTRILERMERNDAGFNNFATAVLDHFQGIRNELGEVKAEVGQVKEEVQDLQREQRRTTAALERFADHEERLRRLEDFMRRAS